MAKAVVGIFDRAEDAQQAVRDLQNRGISQDHVDITERSGIEPGMEEKGEGIAESISNFFSNLFGKDEEEEARNYSEVANRGCTVTVYADSDDEAENAADILDDCGAVDVKERANLYRSGGSIGNMHPPEGMSSTGMGSGQYASNPRSGDTGSTSGMGNNWRSEDLNTPMGSTGSGGTPEMGSNWRSADLNSPSTSGTSGSGSSDWNTPSGAKGSDDTNRMAGNWMADDLSTGSDSRSSGNVTARGGSPMSGDLSNSGNDAADSDMSTGERSSSERTGNQMRDDDRHWQAYRQGESSDMRSERQPGDLNTGVPQSSSDWTERSGEDISSRSDSPQGERHDSSGTAKVHRSRIFETPDDIRNRGGRRHPSAANRNTTGDINPLNQQNPGTTGFNPEL